MKNLISFSLVPNEVVNTFIVSRNGFKIGKYRFYMDCKMWIFTANEVENNFSAKTKKELLKRLYSTYS